MFKHKEVDTNAPYGLVRWDSRLRCEECGDPLGEHSGWECNAPAKAPSSSKLSNPKDAIGCAKAPMSVVPAGVMAEVGVAMLEGMAKYGRHNYRIAGVRASIYYDATMRHLMAWWEGEDTDPDSGLSHVTKAITSLVVLRDAMRNGMVNDDRPPVSPVDYAELNAQAAAILEKHKDKAPRHYTREDKPQ